MKLTELNEKEFEKFASKHQYANFYQTKEWAKLKSRNGWKPYFIGLVSSNKKILGATLLLSKMTPIKKNMFYAPRGFLIDYEDIEMLETFTKEIKFFVKKHNGIFVKIDPMIVYKQRDINGDIVEDGIDNSKIIEMLKSNGYHHYGLSVSSHTGLQPRWVFALPLGNKTEEEIVSSFNTRTKRSLKKCQNHGIIVEKINKNDLSVFKDIMEHTSSRRGFVDRPFSYYQEMIDCLGEHCKIYIAYLDINKAIKLADDEIESQNNRILELNRNKESKKYKENILKCEKIITDKKAEKDKMLKLEKEHGDKIPIGGAMFLHFGQEMTYLFGGSYQEYMEYPSQYLVQFTAIKDALNSNCSLYNFYGIDGHLKEDGEMHGVYVFKKGFGGEVREYIGEFDLIINKFSYFIYKIAFACYHKLKNIKNKKS